MQAAHQAEKARVTGQLDALRKRAADKEAALQVRVTVVLLLAKALACWDPQLVASQRLVACDRHVLIRPVYTGITCIPAHQQATGSQKHPS